MSTRKPVRPFRSREWFADSERYDMTAVYLERFMNYGLTAEELRSGRPIIGIAQSGSDLAPCNRVHIELAKRIREGIRDAGGSRRALSRHDLARAVDRLERRPARGPEARRPAPSRRRRSERHTR